MMIFRTMYMSRLWVAFVLLFAFQASGAGEYVDTNLSEMLETSAPCHENGSEENSVNVEMKKHDGENCCADGCSMSSCHSTSVLPNSLTITKILTPRSRAISTQIIPLSKPSSSLYRPPILG